MKKLMFLFAAALMMAACSNEEIATNDDVQYVSELKLNFGGGDSRVAATHSAAGLKFAWEEGDMIDVWEEQNTSASRKMFIYDAAAGCFKPYDNADINKLVVGKKYFAVIGGTQNHSMEDGKSVLTMNLKSDLGIKGLPMMTDVFEATAENTMATMHHTVGVVEIPVKAATEGAKLKRLGLQTDPEICGEFKVSPNNLDSWVHVSEESVSYNQINSASSIELSTAKAASIFVPALSGTYTTINLLYTLEGGVVKTMSDVVDNLTVERGKITKVSEVILE